MRTQPQWSTNCQGWYVTTIDGPHRFSRKIFIALMRKSERSWKWLGYANGRALGEFHGLTEAKKRAPAVARACHV